MRHGSALYLLASVASIVATSSLRSLFLALRSLPLALSRAVSPAPAPTSEGTDQPARLYEGRVHHARRRPVSHAFDYPVRYALFDLDRSPQPAHLSAARAREAAGTTGAVHLLTIPESVGYEQNPLSIYYCYDLEQEREQQEGRAGEDGQFDRLKMCIAEVTNTPWGERVMFTFQPGSDCVAKPLHVSPFMDMLGNWIIRADAPGQDLSVAISVEHPTLGNYFTATLHAKLVCSSAEWFTLATFFWMMPHLVTIGIYWQAFRLWLKGVRFLCHPKHGSPNYRDDALIRDKELSFSCNYLQSMNSSTTNNNGGSRKLDQSTTNTANKERWCVWRDAQWPWS